MPSSSRASNESSERTQIEVRFRVTAVPTKAIVRPSGDMRGNDRTTPGGEVTVKRVGCGAGSVWSSSRAVAAAATIASTAASPHARCSRDLRRATTGAGAPICDPPSAIQRSCVATSCAVCQRWSGSFIRQMRTSRSSAGGVIGASDDSGAGLALMIEAIRLAWLRPSNALCPVTIS